MATDSTKVTIKCPRCHGHGQRPNIWMPNAGICYRCKGSGTVVIDVEAYKRALVALRRKWAVLNRQAKTMPVGPDRDEAEGHLSHIVTSGRTIRETLDSLGVSY